MTDVAHKRLEPPEAALIAHGLPHRCLAAVPRRRASSGLALRRTGRDLVVELQGRQALELLAELLIGPALVERAEEPARRNAQAGHASPPAARNRAMIAVVWAQSRDARAISARPRRVNA